MKRKNIINKCLVAGALVFATGFTSCEDYLTVLPSDRITEDDFWKSKADLNNVRASAYKQMATSAVTSRILFWGELRSDNLAQNNMTRTNVELLRKGVLHPTDGMFDWAPFYKGINYCNKVLEQGEVMTTPGKEVDPSFRRGDWLPIKAEMLSVRALYYLNLVRAYRNVPYVDKSISTDAEANAGSRIKAELGVNILGKLIADLEDAKNYAAEDYSNAMERKGRFTKRSVHALLADIYLWRGCMLKHSLEKGDTIVMADSLSHDTLSQEVLDQTSVDDFNHAIEHCDYVLNAMQKDYEEDLILHPEWADEKDRNEYFPYMLFIDSKATEGVFDYVYSNIFGVKNSEESVFELQYDGTILTNSTYNEYLSSYGSGSLSPKVMVGAPELINSATSNYNPTRGFGKGDIRLVETFLYTPANAQRPPIQKNVAKSVYIPNILNVTDQNSVVEPEYRIADSQDANWPFYRLSDVMLIKAEAIARVNPMTVAIKEKDKVVESDAVVMQLVEGFKLVNSIFTRCNPGVKAPGPGAGEATSERCKAPEDYVLNRLPSDLLDLVYAERQREFVAEGKRWFDIVRQAEATNDVPGTLTSFITVTKEVKSRLRTLWAMYVPIYSEELKVNGVEHGGALVQNPVWDRYTKN